MTSILDDPLAANLLPADDRQAQPGEPSELAVRPFGLTRVTEVAPTRVNDQSDWTYDPRRQLTVTGEDTPAFAMPHAGTVDTQKTVVDHQEWDDKNPD